jgi:hypothetical protein
MRQWLVSLVFLFLTPGVARCLPVDAFNHAAEIRCKAERTCGRGLRSTKSIGGFLALGVQTGSGTQSTVTLKTSESGGTVAWISEGQNPGRLTLSWDSDSNPWQLSGGGLRCLDLKADGSSALTVKGVAFSAACDKGEKDCPSLIVEARMYDADDPTGQRYSTSVIRRHRRSSGRDLLIPYSSFTREGPNGFGRATCVGALSVSFRADGLTNAQVSFGKVFTNGACQGGDCVMQSPLAPYFGVTATPTPVATKPLPIVSPTESPRGTPIIAASTPQPTPRLQQAVVPKPDVLPMVSTPTGFAKVGRELAAASAPPQPLPEEDKIEEAVYGQVIVMQPPVTQKFK